MNALEPLFKALDKNASQADIYWYVIRKTLLTADAASSLESTVEGPGTELIKHTLTELAGKVGLSATYDHLPDVPSVEDAKHATVDFCKTLRAHTGATLLAYRNVSDSTESLKSSISHIIRQKAMEADRALMYIKDTDLMFPYYPLLVSRQQGFSPVDAIQSTFEALKAFSHLSKTLNQLNTLEEWLTLIKSTLPVINAGLPIYAIALTGDTVTVGVVDPQPTSCDPQEVSLHSIKPLIAEITDYLNENHDLVAMPGHTQLNEAAFTGSMDLVNCIRLEIPKLLQLTLFSQLTYVNSAAIVAAQKENQ